MKNVCDEWVVAVCVVHVLIQLLGQSLFAGGVATAESTLYIHVMPIAHVLTILFRCLSCLLFYWTRFSPCFIYVHTQGHLFSPMYWTYPTWQVLK